MTIAHSTKTLRTCPEAGVRSGSSGWSPPRPGRRQSATVDRLPRAPDQSGSARRVEHATPGHVRRRGRPVSRARTRPCVRHDGAARLLLTATGHATGRRENRRALRSWDRRGTQRGLHPTTYPVAERRPARRVDSNCRSGPDGHSSQRAGRPGAGQLRPGAARIP